MTYLITPLSQSLLENSDFLCKGQTQQLIHFQWLKHLLPQGPEQVSNGQGSEGLDASWYRPGLPPEMTSTHSPPPSIQSSPVMSRLQLCPSVTLPNLFLILLLIPPLLPNSSSAVLPGLLTLKGRFILPHVLFFLIVDGTWVRWSCCLQADVLCNLSVSFLKTLAYFTLVSFPSHLVEKASKTKTRTSYAVNFKVDTEVLFGLFALSQLMRLSLMISSRGIVLPSRWKNWGAACLMPKAPGSQNNVNPKKLGFPRAKGT